MANTQTNPRSARSRDMDRARVSGSQGYELRYFARKHGLSLDQAHGLVKQVGNVRTRLNEAADKLKSSLH